MTKSLISPAEFCQVAIGRCKLVSRSLKNRGGKQDYSGKLGETWEFLKWGSDIV